MVLSHLGRPQEGQFSEVFSLAPVAHYLSTRLDREVRLVRDWLDGVALSDGDVVLCENVRFNTGELDNSSKLSKRMASLTDVFVMAEDAAVRYARLRLVKHVEHLILQLADVSEIVQES